MYTTAKSAICRSYESVKSKNCSNNTVNSEKKFLKNEFVETKQGDSLFCKNSYLIPTQDQTKIVNKENTNIRKTHEDLEKGETLTINKEEIEQNHNFKIDDLITKVLNERGEEYIKIRIGSETQEIKEINYSNTSFDLDHFKIEKYKKSLNDILKDNKLKLSRLKEQLEFGKAKLLQANKSIMHLTGIKRLHEFSIDDHIKKRDNILLINHSKDKKNEYHNKSVEIIKELVSVSSRTAECEKSGYKKLQNIQKLLEKKRIIVKEIGDKENTIKELLNKEEETFYDPEWVPSKIAL